MYFKCIKKKGEREEQKRRREGTRRGEGRERKREVNSLSCSKDGSRIGLSVEISASDFNGAWIQLYLLGDCPGCISKELKAFLHL